MLVTWRGGQRAAGLVPAPHANREGDETWGCNLASALLSWKCANEIQKSAQLRHRYLMHGGTAWDTFKHFPQCWTCRAYLDFHPFRGFLCSLHREENNFTRYLEGLPCLTSPAEQLGLQWLPNPGKHCWNGREIWAVDAQLLSQSLVSEDIQVSYTIGSEIRKSFSFPKTVSAKQSLFFFFFLRWQKCCEKTFFNQVF